MRRFLISLLLMTALSLVLLPAGARADSSPATIQNHWTKCVLTYGPSGSFESKVCYHIPMPNEHRQRIGHTWREVARPGLPNGGYQSVRVTWPIFQPPAIDMSATARPCAWPWRGYIAAASNLYGVPTRVIAATLCTESTGRVCPGDEVDPYGSNGLMQLLPGTAAWVMGVSQAYATQMLCNPGWNVLAGTKYLLMQYRAFGYSWRNAAGAYNAGSWINYAYLTRPNGWDYYYFG